MIGWLFLTPLEHPIAAHSKMKLTEKMAKEMQLAGHPIGFHPIILFELKMKRYLALGFITV